MRALLHRAARAKARRVLLSRCSNRRPRGASQPCCEQVKHSHTASARTLLRSLRMIALNSKDATGEVTALLQQLIRNECVNDGSRESGHETRSVDDIEDVLGVDGIDVARFRAV